MVSETEDLPLRKPARVYWRERAQGTPQVGEAMKSEALCNGGGQTRNITKHFLSEIIVWRILIASLMFSSLIATQKWSGLAIGALWLIAVGVYLGHYKKEAIGL
jgi:hypothetical protein